MFREINVSDEFRQLVQAVIRLAAPGWYRLSDLLGPAWEPLEAKAELGRWFRRAVDAGEFHGIEAGGKTGRNHQIYHVRRQP